jgi:hypothetical protein
MLAARYRVLLRPGKKKRTGLVVRLAPGLKWSRGIAYITGYTQSTNFPTPNAEDASHNGDLDAFVTTLNPAIPGAGSLLAGTFLGGSSTEYGNGITVESNSAGSGLRIVTVAGETASTNFPFKGVSAAQSSNHGLTDAFVAKFSMPAAANTFAGRRLFSGYLGGSGSDGASAVAVDSNGRIYMTGYGANAGSTDAFVTKIFPEYDPQCHWPHTSGTTTTIFYDWGAGLTTPGTGIMPDSFCKFPSGSVAGSSRSSLAQQFYRTT